MSEASLKGANLMGANLSKTDLSFAHLNSAMLRDANLGKSITIEANFRGANLSNTRFKGGQCSKANFSRADLRGADLSVANLSAVNVSEADLEHATLKQANLRDANFTRSRLFATNFSAAILTGVCLEDIYPSPSTTLTDVVCDYAYLRSNQQERVPKEGIFEQEGISHFFASAQATIDLGLPKDVHWAALTYSLQWLQAQPIYQPIKIQRLEHNNDGTILLRLTTAPDIDKEQLQLDIWRVYEETYRMLEPTEGQAVAKPLPNIDPQQYGYQESINRLFDLLTLTMEALPPNGAVIIQQEGEASAYNHSQNSEVFLQETAEIRGSAISDFTEPLKQPHTL